MAATTAGNTTYIHINNHDLYYDDMGKSDIPIIFLHGFPFDKSMWQNQMNYFKTKCRVLAYDIRGFGQSVDMESALSIDRFANDLMAFMDALQLKKAVICGLSMGGYIALQAVAKAPERFEALILCDTQCIADTPEVKENRYKTIASIENGGLKAFYEGFIKKVFHEDALTHKKAVVAQLSEVVYNNEVQSIKQGLMALAERSETCSILSNLSLDTLILCGRQDAVTPLSESEKMHAAIHGSALRVIENAGHVSNLEQPEAFNAYLLGFLKTLSGLDLEDVSDDAGMV